MSASQAIERLTRLAEEWRHKTHEYSDWDLAADELAELNKQLLPLIEAGQAMRGYLGTQDDVYEAMKAWDAALAKLGGSEKP